MAKKLDEMIFPLREVALELKTPAAVLTIGEEKKSSSVELTPPHGK